MAEQVGDRIFAVRVALGTLKRPASQEALAKLLTRRSGRRYHGSTVSEMETGVRRITLEDIDAIAAVDPMKRGKCWLAFGGDQPNSELPPGTSTIGPGAYASADRVKEAKKRARRQRGA